MLDRDKMFLVIPFMVVREIDGLKKGKSDVAVKAKDTEKFLQSVCNQNSGVVFQKVTEVFQDLEHAENDDTILDCCLYFAKTYPSLILLTNDSNLKLKASIHGIPVSSTSNTTPLAVLEQIKSMSSFDLSPLEPAPLICHDVEMDFGDVDPETYNNFMIVDMPDLLISIYQILLCHFSSRLHKVLKETYGEMAQILDEKSLVSVFERIDNERGRAIPWERYPTPNMRRLVISAKDVERSVRQGVCQFSKGDIQTFVRETIPYLEIFGDKDSDAQIELENLLQNLKNA